MIVQHNMAAANTNRQLGITNGALTKSTEKLSSGYRINRAGDDAAGLSISEKMRGQIRGLNQGSTNAQDGISLIQTAEGALNEVHSILQRMRELAVQGANDTNVAVDRRSIYEEMSQLVLEINRIGCTTEFNTMKLFASDEMVANMVSDIQLETNMSDISKTRATNIITLGAMASAEAGVTDKDGSAKASLQVGANTTQSIKFEMGTLDVTKINFPGGTDDDKVDLSKDTGMLNFLNTAITAAETATSFSGTVYDAFTAAISDIDAASTNISKSRSYLGAIQNRLEHTIANADNTAENLQAAESRVRDINMAEEMVEYSKSSILQQAGQSMLAQANQSTQGVLALLR